ncbi:MAG: hypothetical protein HN929_06050 [Chloroflexi bacterium]|jgi:hypothetical protein|nr:hypothetical protein [Chloroflexota bacterium]
MRNRIIAAIITMLMVSIPISSSCSNPKAEAIEIAKVWTSDVDNIAAVANEIADLVIEDVPGVTGLLASTIKNQIKDEISWGYSTATAHGDSNYSVTATSTVTLALPILGDYGISVDYLLSVDNSAAEVTSWSIDAGSFDFSKIE